MFNSSKDGDCWTFTPTVFGKWIRDVKIIIIKVQQCDGSVESIFRLTDLLGNSVHWYLYQYSGCEESMDSVMRYGYIIKCIYNTIGHVIDLPRLHAGFFYWWTGNRRWWRPPGRCSSSPSCQTDPRAARQPFLQFSAIGRNNLALVYIYMIRSVKEIYWENTVWSYWITLQIV